MRAWQKDSKHTERKTTKHKLLISNCLRAEIRNVLAAIRARQSSYLSDTACHKTSFWTGCSQSTCIYTNAYTKLCSRTLPRTQPKTIAEPRLFTCGEYEEEHTTDLHHLGSLPLQPHGAQSARSAFNISRGGGWTASCQGAGLIQPPRCCLTPPVFGNDS